MPRFFFHIVHGNDRLDDVTGGTVGNQSRGPSLPPVHHMQDLDPPWAGALERLKAGGVTALLR